jgi:hypothetical protein
MSWLVRLFETFTEKGVRHIETQHLLVREEGTQRRLTIKVVLSRCQSQEGGKAFQYSEQFDGDLTSRRAPRIASQVPVHERRV